MHKGYNHPHGRRTVLYLAVLTPGKNKLFDIAQHRRNYEKHVLNREEFSKLTKVWVTKFGYTCLQRDANFDVENHVRMYEEQGGKVTETDLMETLLPELCKDMEDDHPQWEDVIVPNFVYDNDPIVPRILRIIRIHHGYMDGISNLLMLAETQSGDSVHNFPWVINPLEPRQKTIGFWFRLFCLIHLPLVAMKHLMCGIWPRTTKNASWIPDSFTGHTLHGWSEPLDIKLLGDIKSASDCSMPAILTTVLLNALGRFQDEFGQRNDSDEILLGLVSALLPYPSVHLRNKHGILRCELDAGRRDLPRRARLWNINQKLKKISQSPETWLNHVLPSLCGHLPNRIADMGTSLISGDGVISNFPATRESIKLWGSQVEEMAGWVPLLTRAGFGCVTLRYGDKLRFCLNTDEAAINRKELEWLLKVIVEEAKALSSDFSSASRSSSSGSKGSLVGRFLVFPVDQVCENTTDDTTNNNNPDNIDQGVVEMKSEPSREERISRAMRILMSTMNKLKRA
ncbi:uncharacterized protein LOC110859383 isoform X2 [Folsomia candida]|nr:uncharacterized protein LOC110859383 isoform X2 [Folsomia candida]